MIAYNKEREIDEAIRGVVGQRCDFPVELIVMDDCSTDRTGEIARRWADRRPDRVRYVRNERNLGLQRNYIAGFRRATGRYMAVCDADDYWTDSRKLSRMVTWMEANPACAVAFHRVVNLYEPSGEMSLSNGGLRRDLTAADLSRSNFITNSSVLYRRALVDLDALPEWIADDRSPDYAFHMFYAARGTLRFFPRPMGVYRKAAGSAWSLTDAAERLRMSIAVREHLLREFAARPDIVAGLEASLAALRAS
ncbi:MAG: glycosyltransferase, partial [Clostridium sp.]|nr:glycosyltransferase [Clostridium sp.]